MSPTHGREAGTIADQDTCERGINLALVIAFVGHHLLLHNGVGFFDQFGGGLGCDVVEHVGDGAQSVQAAAQRQVIVMELSAGCGRKGTRASAVRRVATPATR